jgi:LPS O-antigen subunit length determinant protein (WzzB/FepE family)
MSDLSLEQFKELQELVASRLSVLSDDINISVGSDGSFNRDELIEHIKDGDEIGKKFIKMDLEFLQSLKTGEIYSMLLEHV